MAETKEKTIQITVKIPETIYEALKVLSAKKHVNMAEVVRGFINKGLSVESYQDNIDMITNIIRDEIVSSLKQQSNRLAAMFNRMTIISAAGYFSNIALISALIDRDRYSTFEKIEKIARRKALAYANMKSPDALNYFTDDDEVKKAIEDLKGGGAPQYVDFDV